MPRTVSYTYDQIKPLIVSEEADGRTMHAEFALPGSDQIFESSAGIRKSRDVGSVVKQQVSRSVVNEVRRGVGRLLRGLLGGGIVGRTARTVVNTSTRETARNVTNAPSTKDKENAVVEAFARVAANFSYDDASGQWGKPSAAAVATPAEKSAFEKQLEANPVNDKFAKSVLARMLAHIAYADGSLADEEKDFFDDSIPEEYGSIEALGKSDPISAVEAEEIQKGARETMLMMAWTISSIDLDVDPGEVALLESYGSKFGISADRQQELAIMAKSNVMEGYFTTDMSRDDLFALARKVGISDEDAERAKIRWMKRQ